MPDEFYVPTENDRIRAELRRLEALLQEKERLGVDPIELIQEIGYTLCFAEMDLLARDPTAYNVSNWTFETYAAYVISTVMGKYRGAAERLEKAAVRAREFSARFEESARSLHVRRGGLEHELAQATELRQIISNRIGVLVGLPEDSARNDLLNQAISQLTQSQALQRKISEALTDLDRLIQNSEAKSKEAWTGMEEAEREAEAFRSTLHPLNQLMVRILTLSIPKVRPRDP